jgi:hypothetical protein
VELANKASPKAATRELVRRALKGALATLDRQSGHPYASLVTIATSVSGAPLLLISKLALHTQNIFADARASLLIDGTNASGDPLATGRVTLIGRIVPSESVADRTRFLARQPHAEMYAGFSDFAFYKLEPEHAHFIGGFGRIVDLPASDVLLDLAGAEALVAAGDEIVKHMNEDHAAAIELYATALCGAESGPWRMTGVDPEGFDIVCDGAARRILFASRVENANEARSEFKRLADLARTDPGQTLPD